MSASNATRYVCRFILLLEAFCVTCSAFAADSYNLIVWHPFVGVQERLFSDWIEEYSAREKLKIRVENAFDLNTALRKKALSREFPDVVIGPLDLLNAADNVPLNPIRESEFLGRTLVSVKERRVAVSLFQNGTHFLLRKRGTRVLASPSDLFSQLEDGKTLVWSNVEPLFLLSFILKEGRDREGVSRALRNFRELMLASNTAYPCDHKCLWNSIVEKRADFAIVGDWQFPDLEKASVGKAYELDLLPSFLGKCASLSYVAFFPSSTSNDGSRLRNSKRLVSWLSSVEIQERVQRRFLQRPSSGRIRASLWPTWMRTAVSAPRECSDVSNLATPEFWALSSAAVRQIGTSSASIDDVVSAFSKNFVTPDSGSSRAGN